LKVKIKQRSQEGTYSLATLAHGIIRSRGRGVLPGLSVGTRRKRPEQCGGGPRIRRCRRFVGPASLPGWRSSRFFGGGTVGRSAFTLVNRGTKGRFRPLSRDWSRFGPRGIPHAERCEIRLEFAETLRVPHYVERSGPPEYGQVVLQSQEISGLQVIHDVLGAQQSQQIVEIRVEVLIRAGRKLCQVGALQCHQ
jgi:hypothetical protein